MLGFYYQEEAINKEKEKELVDWIDKQEWSNKLSRRTQHYGYEYNYNSPGLIPTVPISGLLKEVADWLQENKIINPQQCIINEYFQDQGISPHIDAKIFGPVIVSISLLEPCNMIFSGKEKIRKILNPRSILILTGESRYIWKHEIPRKKTIIFPDGTEYQKSSDYRRISLTFRTIA